MSRSPRHSWLNVLVRSWFPGRPVRQRRRRSSLLQVEQLETRLTPTAYLVNIIGDFSASTTGTASSDLNVDHGDLRYCLNQAIADKQTDTITFDPTVLIAHPTITLNSSLVTPSGVTNPYGQTAFIAGKNDNITIDGSLGPNGPGITIDGGGATRLFAVAGGGILNLKNLTLTGGDATGQNGVSATRSGGGGGGAGMGGAVFVDGSTFTANGCTFNNNTATGGTGGSSSNGASATHGGSGGGLGSISPPNPTAPPLDVFGAGGIGGGQHIFFSSQSGTARGFPGGFGGGGGGGLNGGANNSGGSIGAGGGGGGFGGGGGGSGAHTGASPAVNGIHPGGGGFGAGGGGGSAPGNTGAAGGGGGGAGLGGAIFSTAGTLTLTNSTFTQNTAKGGAGGSGGSGGGSGQGLGGAVFVRNGSLNATFVTFSSNTVTNGGSGLNLIASDLFVLSDNSSGPGFSGGSATAKLVNDILGQTSSTVSDFAALGINGASTPSMSGSSNDLVSNNSPQTVGKLQPAGLSGVNITGGNPNFSGNGLFPNGGPTNTIALTSSSSLAIAKGANGTGITVDQRGFTRTSPPDLGACQFSIGVTATPPTGAVEGAALSNITVATFTDPNPSATASDYSVTVTWGGTAPNTVVTSTNGKGTITESGGIWTVTVNSFTYPDALTNAAFSVTVDDTADGATGTDGSQKVSVGDAALSVTAMPPTGAVVSVPLTNVTVATFTDANPQAPASDYTVTVTWGGTAPNTVVTSTNGKGTITKSGSTWTVTVNSFTYTQILTNAMFSVKVADVDSATDTDSSKTVSVANSLNVTATPPTGAVEGAPLSNIPVATFTDANPTATASDYTVTVTWGGTAPNTVVTSTNGKGTITKSGSTWTVTVNSFTYPDALTNAAFSIEVDAKSGVTDTDNTKTVSVADAALSVTATPPTGAVQGRLLTNIPVATFTDANPSAPASDYIVIVTWGGTAPATVVTSTNGNGTITKSGSTWTVTVNSFTYLQTLTNVPFYVEVDDVDGATDIDTSKTVSVTNSLSVTATPPTGAVEGAPLTNIPVATFTDANPTATASDYTVTVTWGGTAPNTVVTSTNGKGTITKSGSTWTVTVNAFTYPDALTSALFSVTVDDLGGATDTDNTKTVSVADAALTVTATPPTGAVVNVPLTNIPVATFTDANPQATASDYTVTVAWGGTAPATVVTSANGNGTITKSGGTWTVTVNAFTYREVLTNAPFSVEVDDVDGATATDSSKTVVVANSAQPLPPGPTPTFNFDELGAYRPSDGSWSLDSNGQFAFQTGGPEGQSPLSDRVMTSFSPSGPQVIPVSGDWAGLGTSEIGDFEAGTWHLDLNDNGKLDSGETFSFGTTGDLPLPGHFLPGAGIELGVYRSMPQGFGVVIISDPNWQAEAKAGQQIGTASSFIFGAAGDHVVVGDWDGQGLDEVGVYRPGTAWGAPDAYVWSLDVGNHHVLGASTRQFLFGYVGDGVVIGDWNGTGIDNVGVYRPAIALNAPNTAVFSLDEAGEFAFGADSQVFEFGTATDKFVTGHWAYTTSSASGAAAQASDMLSAPLSVASRSDPTALDTFFASS